MTIVELNLPHHRYEIQIGPGLLDQLGPVLRSTVGHDRAALFADGAVADLHGPLASRSLEQTGYNHVLHRIPSGEQHKTLETVRSLYDVLLEQHAERGSPVIALGGGVVGDTVGFAAATYLRGVPFVQCPTTLLAMVDASVGGKVGVNVPQGKNLIGSFHQPAVVVVDVDTLSTLPARELRCGLAECVKHAVIRDEAKFDWLEENLDAILGLDRTVLTELVCRNVAIKARVVEADEKEAGVRAHLNFGHTFAHAIEATTGFGTGTAYHHGEAVSLGMIAASRLAHASGRCPSDVSDRLIHLLRRAGLPVEAPGLPPNDLLLQAMRLDKKVRDNRLRLILPDRIGAVSIDDTVPQQAITDAWDSLRG